MERPIYDKTESGDMGFLTEPYVTSWGDIIPKDWYWDGMTANFMVGLPKFGDNVDRASLEHDYPYVYEGKLPSGKIMTRKETDILLRYNLLISGNPIWKCELAYNFVRAFGWIKWKRKDKKTVNKNEHL